MHYYEVAPTKIVRSGVSTLTYSSSLELSRGQIVRIEVGSKQLVGVVISISSKPTYAVKPIEHVIEATPLPEPILKTAEWMASYYLTPLAQCVQTILPTGVQKSRRLPLKNPSTPIPRKRTNYVFTPDQRHAIDSIRNSTPGSILLHGVTGSGKTAVYIEIARDTINNGQSVIILVPEIGLTSQLVAEFSAVFDDVIVTHSKQSEADRHRTWKASLESRKPLVVIGPRSALFLPLKSVGLIVVDESHEPSYKQDKSPRYSALRAARILADAHQAKLILGSATPSVVDYYLASSHDRPIISMSGLARPNAITPKLSVVDMTKKEHHTRHRFLSDTLLNQLSSTIASGNQTLIYHNRRGSASITLCDACGWIALCPDTFVPLTLHADSHILQSHLTGVSWPVPTSCPECHNTDIIHKGIGTKLIESELRKLYPNTSIVRFDGDTESARALDKQYDSLRRGDIQLIIGTQVIAKGLDLPHLRTVGVVQADGGLSLPDYVSAERTFQLLSQVIGRVGRTEHETRVILQTYQPSHPAIIDSLTQNYHDFYARTIVERKRANFPPFSHLLRLECIYKQESTTIAHTKSFARTIAARANPRVTILGPSPSFYERVSGSYRWQLIIKSSHRQDLLDIVGFLPPSHWQYELDPMSLI